MAQKIFFAFRDDDSTWDLNRRFLGILEPGVYRGFRAQSPMAAGLNLTLSHYLDGSQETKKDLSLSDKFGVILTKQGGIVREDAEIVLPITTNGPASQPRIDLVYLEHQYVDVTGGTAATYGVVQGSAAATPTVPTLPSPNIQIAIGELYMPAGATGLNATGAKFTRYDTPGLAGNGNIMYTNKEQLSTALKIFDNLAFSMGTSVADMTSNTTLTLVGDNINNFYTINNNPNSTGHPEWITVTEILTLFPVPEGFPVYLFNTGPLKITSENGINLNNGDTRYINAYEGVTIIKLADGTGNWSVMSGGEAYRGSNNKFKNSVQSFDGADVDITAQVNEILLPQTGNSFTLTNAHDQVIKSILLPTIAQESKVNYRGTFLILTFTETVRITHRASGINAGGQGYKAINLPTVNNVVDAVETFPASTRFLLVENNNQWDVVSYFGAQYGFVSLWAAHALRALSDTDAFSASEWDTLIFKAATQKWTKQNVFEPIRNQPHQFTKLQTWGTAQEALTLANPSLGHYTAKAINPGGNHFILSYGPGQAASLLDDFIQDITGLGTAAFPTDTLITVKIASSIIPTIDAPMAWGSNINTDYFSFTDWTTPLTVSSSYGVITQGLPILMHGCTYVLLKSASKWIIVSATNHLMARTDAQIAGLASTYLPKALQAWQTPSGFTSPYTSWAPQPIRYRKDQNGHVWIKGALTNSSGANGIAFNLPAGYRPPEQRGFSVNNTSDNTPVTVYVDASGDVSCYGGMGGGYHLCLDGVSFFVD